MGQVYLKADWNPEQIFVEILDFIVSCCAGQNMNRKYVCGSLVCTVELTNSLLVGRPNYLQN